ncbi:DNA-binding MarR family transcriptional regulator [Allocatelliglobosispora scoriae]|uniref:DNA-binding MarR family transcriptional regulator n=1 Tax=Allocatelliglobosispora scoriae TaxID=643052 RepID=A0A841BSB2_9ACTN|nr:helix-turn-helix domain-containing protein [Allocatelliglobosispora scoriae]MBB5870286.1 DNA-binding MarR family transcriptional regulator [Allocatelliglobosispora scoriae]
MTEPTRVELRGKALRGIAHPLRVRLLSLLREDGPSTATRLGERLAQSSGATSYHLRQLAAYGFVVEDDTQGDGRERWWRAAHETTTLQAEDARASPADSEAYLRAVAAEYADRVDRWLGELTTIPEEWHEGMTLSNALLRLRPEEAARFLVEFQALIDTYRRDEPAGELPDGTERVMLQYQLMPFPRVAGHGGDLR